MVTTVGRPRGTTTGGGRQIDHANLGKAGRTRMTAGSVTPDGRNPDACPEALLIGDRTYRHPILLTREVEIDLEALIGDLWNAMAIDAAAHEECEAGNSGWRRVLVMDANAKTLFVS